MMVNDGYYMVIMMVNDGYYEWLMMVIINGYYDG